MNISFRLDSLFGIGMSLWDVDRHDKHYVVHTGLYNSLHQFVFVKIQKNKGAHEKPQKIFKSFHSICNDSSI